jgi:trimeric autotransporter adhesin
VSNAILVAPQIRPMRVPFTVHQRASVGLAAVALAVLAAAGLPTLSPSHLGGSQPLPREGGITSLSIANSAQGLTASFGSGGATVSSDGARFTLGLTAFGRGAQAEPVAPVQPQVGAGIVRYQYPAGVTETWQNRPLGLEQSFILSSRPAGDAPLTVAMTAPAASSLVHGAVSLPGGLRYAGLRATDARGRLLHSWLALSRGQLSIKVSDRGAQYPVRIDPLVQQAGLTEPNGVVGDEFGSSVAVSGSTLAVGAPNYKVGANGAQGAVFVFSDRSGHWKRTAELTVSGGFADQIFGTQVAMSGNTIVASAPNSGATGQGALFVFSDGSGHWKQVAELTASDAAQGDHLGTYSIAMQGKTIIAGSTEHKVGSVVGQGAVYVFDEPSGGWATKTQSAELSEKHGALDDGVGWAVAISGNTIVAGAPAPFEEDGHQSALFVFTKRSGHWRQTAELHPRGTPTYDDIGQAVAISGDTIAAGAAQNSTLYVFHFARGKWKQTATLGYTQCNPTDCLTDNALGGSVAFEGSAILASAEDVSAKGDFLGAIPEYREISGRWREVSRVLAGQNQHSTQEQLIATVASSGSTVVTGLYNGVEVGSVVVFKGRVTSEGPLIGEINSGAAGEATVPVTCELPAHGTCRVTVGVHRAGSKQVLGHAKPKNIRGTDIRSVTVHFNAAFERLLSRPNGVTTKFTVRETSHGKVKASGSTTVTFTAE